MPVRRPATKTRCAVYTRKSSEEGLEQSFNSLHAQREACEAFIQSQRHEGWSVVVKPYDDGGFSGGTMERPGLKQLLADIESGEVDVVVVYKIDRLTRSLFDFAKIVEIFDAKKVSFVSVTQSFNTTTSMGRLTLNVLLSFAQFEREVTGERIRDKVAASKRRGMWMGGHVPLGYDLKDRKLVINEQEGLTVQTIFGLYAELGSVRNVKAELDRLQLKTKLQKPASGIVQGGLPFRIGHLYTILRNRLYRGEIAHKGQIHPGDHPPIIEQALWEAVQARLASNATVRRSGSSSKEPSLLAGLLFDSDGNLMTPSHAVKNGKRYRYYISNNLVEGAKSGRDVRAGSGLRIGAREIECHVSTAVAAFLNDAEKLIRELQLRDNPAKIQAAVQITRSIADEILKPDRCHVTLRAFLSRVTVGANFITIELRRGELLQHLGWGHEDSTDDEPFRIELAAQLRQVGKEKCLIVAAHAPASNPDSVLIKAIVRAHQWFEMLKNHRVASVSELATQVGLPRTYVGSIVPFALLAPDITEAILDGRQPIGLTLDRLFTVSPLPILWKEQRAVLGFGERSDER